LRFTEKPMLRNLLFNVKYVELIIDHGIPNVTLVVTITSHIFTHILIANTAKIKTGRKIFICIQTKTTYRKNYFLEKKILFYLYFLFR
jgi:hypothetical protein